MVVIKRVALVVALLVLLATAAGFLLPTAWQVERSVWVQAPASSVFPYLNSLKRWPEWTVWISREPDLRMDYSGPDAGMGATSRWSGRDGYGAMKIMVSDTNQRIEYQLLFEGGRVAMHGELLLTPETTGTRVTWRTGGATGRNPIARYLGLLMPRWIGKDFEESLQRLKQKLEAGR